MRATCSPRRLVGCPQSVPQKTSVDVLRDSRSARSPCQCPSLSRRWRPLRSRVMTPTLWRTKSYPTRRLRAWCKAHPTLCHHHPAPTKVKARRGQTHLPLVQALATNSRDGTPPVSSRQTSVWHLESSQLWSVVPYMSLARPSQRCPRSLSEKIRSRRSASCSIPHRPAQTIHGFIPSRRAPHCRHLPQLTPHYMRRSRHTSAQW